MSRLLNPAVRGITAAVNAASTLVPVLSGPRVPGFPLSAIRNTAVPTTSRATVTMTVIRVSTDQDFGVRHSRASSNTTGKPRPPTMTAAQMVRLIHGSATYCTRLSALSPNPALLNDEMAWNTPEYAADGSDWP